MSRAPSQRERSRRYIENGVVRGDHVDWWFLAFWVVYLTGITLTFITLIYVIIGAL